tara:strand:- start:1112 stop:1654 length:543 start_codon:yes stop_codon:yes gene_type:complete
MEYFIRDRKLVEQKPFSHLRKQFINGFTLVELLIVLSIIGILAALAMPSFMSNIEKRKIISAAEMVSSDLKWARSESIKQNQELTVDFTDGAGGTWGYTITPTTPTKTVSSSDFADFSGIVLNSDDFAGNDTGFEPVRGKSTDSGNVTLTSTNLSIDVRVSGLGRISICSSTGVGGVDAC